ncbi:DUF1796 family putative cysteine peptidase [Bacillus thuringiensis]|nr:DUF1796 family putative cysteine peptidase [Bacillus thuringiensis]HDR6268575.1 hypothetical protein [Bacillus cereus]
MNLKKMKDSYDAVISLGAYCQTAYQLKRKKLRGSSTPLDWMISPSLKDINCLLRNQFRDFMEYKNLKISDVTNQYTHLIIDELYHIESHHDFPIAEQSQDPLSFYPIFKKKLDSKIDNFNKLLLCSKKILFVRMVANHYEIVELNTVLQQLTNSDFFILVINFSKDNSFVERFWNIDNVCSVEIRNTFPGRWEGCDLSWDKILNGVSISHS